MKLISTVSVGAGGATQIEFTGIPQTATDLVILLSYRGTTSGNSILLLQANNITTTSYASQLLRGENGIGAVTGTGFGITDSYIPGLTGGTILTANSFSSARITLTNYTSTTNKAMMSEHVKETNDSTYYELGVTAGQLSTSSPITSVKLTFYGGATFAQHTSASLYTITKGSGGATVS